jgi:hypothetical protein
MINDDLLGLIDEGQQRQSKPREGDSKGRSMIPIVD